MSFDFEIPEKDADRADLISRIGLDLQRVFVHRKQQDGTTQQQIAENLDVDRSRVNRCLSGHANLTLGTLSDLMGAMRAKMIVKIVPEEQASHWALCWRQPSVEPPVSKPVVNLEDRPQTSKQQIAAGNWK